jgi:hypothetical protein
MNGQNKLDKRRSARMGRFFWATVIAGLAGWIISLRQRLQAAQMRGDMYRDIAARLDQQLVVSNERGR